MCALTRRAFSLTQASLWELRADEVEKELSRLVADAEDSGFDMREVNCSEFKKHTLREDDRLMYERVTRELDLKHPIVRHRSSVGEEEDDDDEESREVDVLDPTAKPRANDKAPDRMAVFDKENDDDESMDGRADDEDEPEDVVDAYTYQGFSVPVDIMSVLKPHQKNALWLMIERAHLGSGALLAHGPGLGKTLTTLCMLSCYKRYHTSYRSIVVCAKSLILQWEAEMEKFKEILHLEAFTVDESSKLWRVHKRWSKSRGVLLIGTDLFKQQFENKKAGKQKAAKVQRCELAIDADTVVVVDEAHQQLQTGTSHFYDVLKELPTTRRILLSGTPMQNSLREYYNMVWLIASDVLPAKHLDFQKEYGRAIEKSAQRDAEDIDQKEGTLKLIMLRKKLQPVVSFESSEEILSSLLPAKHETLILHGIDDHASLSEEGNAFDRRNAVHAATLDTKLQIVEVLIKQFDPSERVLVFSSRIHTLKHIQTHFACGDLLIGEVTDMYARDQILTNFRETPGTILFVSLELGACGLNLSCASRVILLDVSWNPMIDNQAIARAYRLGQQNNVMVYRLCAMGTLEERAYILGVRKNRLATGIVDDHDVARVYDHGDLYPHANDEAGEGRLVEYHASYIQNLKKIDATESQLLYDLVQHEFFATNPLYLADHLQNVTVESKRLADERENEHRNETHRLEVLQRTRSLDGKTVPIDTIVGEDGEFVPPMPIAWVDTAERADVRFTGQDNIYYTLAPTYKPTSAPTYVFG